MVLVFVGRCVLRREECVKRMSGEHKPLNQVEQDRIYKAGGTVIEKNTVARVNGEYPFFGPAFQNLESG